MKERRVLKSVLPIIVLLGTVAAFGIRQWLGTNSHSNDLVVMLKEHPLRHLGIIMDGNRRWARQHGYKPWIGHRHGVEPVRAVVKFCLQYAIPYVTLYAFSLENFKRPSEELHFLFDVLAQEIASKEFDELVSNGVRITFAGDSRLFPEQLRGIIDDVTEKSAQNTKLYLTILFCYGGRQELCAAAHKVCADIIAQGETAEACTPERFEAALWTGDLPPADLIIRTGKEPRLSNFLLYKAAYSDFHLIDCYWPDLTEKDLVRAVRIFVQTKHSAGV